MIDASHPEVHAAYAYVRRVLRGNSENFSVTSIFVPSELRDDFAAVYAFCRIADDAADETGIGPAARARSLKLLAQMRLALDLPLAAWIRPAPSQNPLLQLQPGWTQLFTALSLTRSRHDLSITLFTDLLTAFEADQHKIRYDTLSELIDYSTKSANPVGRIVLHLFGFRPAASPALFDRSDDICTALQLTNFWQDVRRDLVERDRIYLPLREAGLTEEYLRSSLHSSPHPAFGAALLPLAAQTSDLFARGGEIFSLMQAHTLPHARRAARVVQLFDAGGRAVLDSVIAMRGATLWHRPRLSKWSKLRLIFTALISPRYDRPLS